MELDQLELIKCRNIELEEQLKLCLEDLRKKDEHITALSSMEIKRSSSQSGEAIESRAELVSTQMQLSIAIQKLEESEINVKSKAGQVDELRASNRDLNEQLQRSAMTEAELRTELAAVDKKCEEMSCANARSELAIAALQRELNSAVDNAVQLEARLRAMAVTNSSAEEARQTLAARIGQFYGDLTAHLGLEMDSEPPIVFDKIKLVTAENNSLKGEIYNLKTTAAEREEKYLESRESIRKMMLNVDKEKGDLEEYIRMKRELTFETEKVKMEKMTVEGQKTDLEKQLVDVRKLLEETKRILEEKEAQLAKIYLEKRESSFTMVNASREIESFKESLASLLGSPFIHCGATEDIIKERVRSVVQEVREKERTIADLQGKLRTITEQYERHYESAKDSGLKARRVELEYLDLTERIRQLEKELSTRDVSRDVLRAEKEKFYHFLRRLTAILKMDHCNHDLDFSLVFDGILERAAQLAQSENDRNIDTNQTICALKKRLRDIKDQLHSRDLHLELMRKKMAGQDDKIREAYEEADQRRDLVDTEETLKEKLGKMQKKVEQLRNENKVLKAELFECSDIKRTAANQNKELETLQHNLQKLERVRQKQAEKIAEFTKHNEIYESEATQTRVVADNAVQSLTSEMKILRSSLERTKRSEKELLDFRAVVGRIIGLCTEDLAIPNYDIIRRLEKLVSMPKSGLSVAVPVPHYPMRNGYEDANRLLGRKRRSPIRTIHQDLGRPRSVSPIHEPRDSRKY